MDFPFDVEKLLRPDAWGLVLLQGKNLTPYTAPVSGKAALNRFQTAPKNDDYSQCVGMIVDLMGEASSKAQQLPQTITTMARFGGTSQRLYLKVCDNKVEGLLKVGEKNIFYRDPAGKVRELTPVCVLDFYVHESVQRKGVGHQLFMRMLEVERVLPNKLAYDRPSPKLIKFLEKYFDLKSFVPQNNNFVIYDAYWRPNYKIPASNYSKMDSVPQQKKKPATPIPETTAQPPVQFTGVQPQKQTIESYHKEPAQETYQTPEEDEEDALARELLKRQEEHDAQVKQKLFQDHLAANPTGYTKPKQKISAPLGRPASLQKVDQPRGAATNTYQVPPVAAQKPNFPKGGKIPTNYGSFSAAKPKEVPNPYLTAPGGKFPAATGDELSAQNQQQSYGNVNQPAPQSLTQRGLSTGNAARPPSTQQDRLPQPAGPHLTKYTRELSTLDNQIDRTEREIMNIRNNIQMMQNEYKQRINAVGSGPTRVLPPSYQYRSSNQAYGQW